MHIAHRMALCYCAPVQNLSINHKFMTLNTLVTGGAGFIGSHLVKRLLAEESSRVVALDNFEDFYPPAFKRENVEPYLEASNFELVEADIRDQDALEPIFKERKIDTVVHLAAKAGVRPSLLDPQGYADANINGTLNLLETCRKHDVKKFVFGSSSSVYGSRSKVPFSEDDSISKPISPYAATKAAGEMLCHTYSHLYGMKIVCLRFFTVYGARQRPDLAIRKFSEKILAGQPIQMYGDGTTRRDYTYIDDIIDGVIASISYDQTVFEVINLGEAETVELRELISLIESSLGREAIIEEHPVQPGDVPLTCADISKAGALLGYDPQTKIDEGIQKFADWMISARSGAQPA